MLFDGDELMVLGIAAIAAGGVLLVVTLGGVDSVEGTVHTFSRGLPQRSAFPVKESVFWFDRGEC